MYNTKKCLSECRQQIWRESNGTTNRTSFYNGDPVLMRFFLWTIRKNLIILAEWSHNVKLCSSGCHATQICARIDKFILLEYEHVSSCIHVTGIFVPKIFLYIAQSYQDFNSTEMQRYPISVSFFYKTLEEPNLQCFEALYICARVVKLEVTIFRALL